MIGAAAYARVQAPDLDALVAQHTALVKRIAYHLAARLPKSVQPSDLIQAGMIGLIEAARHYDAAQGASFETYAGIRIRGAMLDEVRRGACRTPRAARPRIAISRRRSACRWRSITTFFRTSRASAFCRSRTSHSTRRPCRANPPTAT